MSPLTVLVLFGQACLIQVAVGQYGCSNNLRSVNLAPSSITVAAPTVSSVGCGGYGGSGEGVVVVEGSVCGSGQTVATGAVPCAGTASFSGPLSASGAVSITGQCGCECSA